MEWRSWRCKRDVGTRLTEAFMSQGGASTDKKTQGAAVPPWKDQRELGHLRFYSVSNRPAFFGPAVLGELRRPAGSPVCVPTYSTSRTGFSVCMSQCSFISPSIFPRVAWTPRLYVSSLVLYCGHDLKRQTSQHTTIINSLSKSPFIFWRRLSTKEHRKEQSASVLPACNSTISQVLLWTAKTLRLLLDNHKLFQNTDLLLLNLVLKVVWLNTRKPTACLAYFPTRCSSNGK